LDAPQETNWGKCGFQGGNRLMARLHSPVKRINVQADHRRGEQSPAIAWQSVAAAWFPSNKLMERKRFVMAALLVELVRQGSQAIDHSVHGSGN
jgi:hypothetical protein